MRYNYACRQPIQKAQGAVRIFLSQLEVSLAVSKSFLYLERDLSDARL